MEYFREVKEAFMQADSQEGIRLLIELCDITKEEAEKAMKRYQDLEESRLRFISNEDVCADIEVTKSRLFLTYAALASVCNKDRGSR